MAEPLMPEPLRHRLPPLSWWKVSLSAAAVILVGIAVGWWLWFEARDLTGADLGKAHTEAIRTGLTAAAGTGAALALLLAVRRQRATEVALELQSVDLAQKERDLGQKERAQQLQERVADQTRAHQENVAADARYDAAERRITELYTKAADQLGSDKAPVRLAGLHALERLAQGNPDHRQTIVDVVCAYLRMPYQLPEPLVETAAPEERHEAARREQELQVRLSAQRILAAHLRPDFGESNQPVDRRYWPNIDLDFTGATLIDFSLAGCEIRAGIFVHAHFVGDAGFGGAHFLGGAGFSEAQFVGQARFAGAQFAGGAAFDGAHFVGDTSFDETQFTGGVRFEGTRFTDGARFNQAQFAGGAAFDGAHFVRGVAFDGARFAGGASFSETYFAGDTWFSEAHFTEGAKFARAKFWGEAAFDMAQFDRGTTFGMVQFDRDAVFIGAKFAGDVGFHGVRFDGDVRFCEAAFAGNTWFDEARFAGDVRFGQAETTEAVEFSGARTRTDIGATQEWPPGWTVTQPVNEEARLLDGGWGYLVRGDTAEPSTGAKPKETGAE